MTVSYEEDWEYGASKLSGSIVRYNSEPVWVQNVNEDCIATTEHIITGIQQNVPMRDLNLEPIPLGYCNWTIPTYVTRLPQRSWKQGFRSGNMYCLGHPGSISSESFYNMVKGIYPTIDYALDFLSCDDRKGMAFSRKFSILNNKVRGFLLMYKNREVGTVLGNNGKPELKNKFTYLQEALEQEIYNEL